MFRPVYWLGLVLLLSGCASFTKDKDSSTKSKSWFPWSKKEYQVPHSMAVIWSEDVLTLPGHPVTRGFGGRIYFYNEKSQAIPVEGELIVHGYDESLREKNPNAKPAADKRFRFTAEQFTQHFSESQLGASYNVWIPWDAGGPAKKITLVPSFLASSGNMIRGEASKVTLAGVVAPGTEYSNPSAIQQVSHNEPTVDGPLPRITNSQTSADTMRTTTIQVPREANRRPTVIPQARLQDMPAQVSYGASIPGLNAPNLSSPQPSGMTPQQSALVQAIQDSMTRNALTSLQATNHANTNGNTVVGTIPTAANNLSPANLNPQAIQASLLQNPTLQAQAIQAQALQSQALQLQAIQAQALQQPTLPAPGIQSQPMYAQPMPSPAMQSPPFSAPGIQSTSTGFGTPTSPLGSSQSMPSPPMSRTSSLPGVGAPPMVNLQPNMQSFPNQSQSPRR